MRPNSDLIDRHITTRSPGDQSGGHSAGAATPLENNPPVAHIVRLFAPTDT